jgi:hypothetical protein
VFQLPVDDLTDLQEDNIVYRTCLSGERSVNSEIIEDWKKFQLFKKIEVYDLCDMYNADETSLFFSLLPSKTFTFQVDFCHFGVKSELYSSCAMLMIVINCYLL